MPFRLESTIISLNIAYTAGVWEVLRRPPARQRWVWLPGGRRWARPGSNVTLRSIGVSTSPPCIAFSLALQTPPADDYWTPASAAASDCRLLLNSARISGVDKNVNWRRCGSPPFLSFFSLFSFFQCLFLFSRFFLSLFPHPFPSL